MNDFTKEELEEILKLIDGELHCFCDEQVNLRKTYEKVRNMLENYCDHSEEYEDFNYNPMRCKECKEITG